MHGSSSIRRASERVVGLLAAAVVVLGLATATSSATPQRLTGRDAVSGSVLVARGMARGLIHPQRGTAGSRITISNVQAASLGTLPTNETPVAADPNHALHIAAASNDYNCSPSGALTGVYTSDDGGTTFPRAHCMPTLAGEPYGGDPNIAYAPSGALYAAGLSLNATIFSEYGQLVFQRSNDNGVTWQPLVPMLPAAFTNGLTDKPWMEVDTNATSPRKGTIYVSGTEFNSSFTQSRISVQTSVDGGTTWTRTFPAAAQTSNVDQFSDLAVARDGTVYVSWIRCPGTAGCANVAATMYIASSTDGGATWSAPMVIHSVQMAPGIDYYGDVPGTSERLSNIPVIDVDTSTGARAGTVYETDYTYVSGKTRAEVTSSTNGGVTWSTPVAVFPAQTKNMFFPWLNVSRSGVVGVSYNYGDSSTYGEYGAASTNGGASFVGNAAISTASSSYSSDGFGGTFMGDYTGNDWSSRGFYAAWMDTRTGTGQAEVGRVTKP